MSVDTLAVSLIVDPVTIINVTVRMIQLAFTIGFILTPFALVLGTIWPLLLSITVAVLTKPITFVNSIRI